MMFQVKRSTNLQISLFWLQGCSAIAAHSLQQLDACADLSFIWSSMLKDYCNVVEAMKAWLAYNDPFH